MKTNGDNGRGGLEVLRRQIDFTDGRLVRLFLERMAVTEAIGRYKREHGLPVFNPEREREVLEDVSAQAGELGEYAVRLFETIMALSRERQEKLFDEISHNSGEFDSCKVNRLYGLVGRKLGHSWSRGLHEQLGCPGYELYELEPEQLGGFLSREDIGGLNVTIPYKIDAMRLCDTLSDAARDIGSVNTVTRREDGLFGDNTDIYGFDYMAKRAGIDFAGKKAIILGSGGASLTAQYYSRTQGARETVVVSRGGDDNYGNLYERHADADIIVNATPVGMYPDTAACPVRLGEFGMCSGVLDMIYNPFRTRLIIEAERLGIRRSGGLPMLAAQAAQAERVFGRDVPDSAIDRLICGSLREHLNIVLTGMPGCGKTTVGERLSALCGREVIDTDAEIERAQGMSIPEIFSRHGEDYFRRCESEIIQRVGSLSGVIITTGGGAVLKEENYAPLRSNGVIYHIERPLSELARGGRPLSENADLREMYRQRLPRYEHFRDASVYNGSAGDPDAPVHQIWQDFCQRCRSLI